MTKLIKQNPATAPPQTEVIPRVISIYTCGCRIEDERPKLMKLKTTLSEMVKVENPEPAIRRRIGTRALIYVSNL
ncbi:hypothetical protein NHQ30_007819 [Ciborinia camelliae]|nr:hypothetical protein NHQ30_007819 [Ciborinia camelliae]